MRPCREAMTPVSHLGVLVGTIAAADAVRVAMGAGGFGVPVL